MRTPIIHSFPNSDVSFQAINFYSQTTIDVRGGQMTTCDLSGKTFVVTGAGGAIGRAICVSLGQHGANVVANDVGAGLGGDGTSSKPAQETVNAVEASGGHAVADGYDITDPDAAKAIIEHAVNQFGGIDGVVNNAGILRDTIFHKMSIDAWKSVIDVHLMGSFYISSAAAAQFRTQGHGAFVHMTSTSGLIGNVGQANYAAAKLGLVALSKSIALDMARFGVRSNCVAPFAWSRMISSLPQETEEEKARVARMQKMTPESIAPMVTYLLSDLASNVTGQIFGVRANELYLFSPPRLSRRLHSETGWTPDSIAQEAAPALAPDFCPLDTSAEMFNWDPI